MKTTFTIEADTSTMAVVLRIRQGRKLKYEKMFATVTDAAKFLLNGIATVMENKP